MNEYGYGDGFNGDGGGVPGNGGGPPMFGDMEELNDLNEYLGAAAPAEEYREVPDPTDSRYVYRQYPHGKIVVIKAPPGKAVNVTLTSGPAWEAISSPPPKGIGPYPAASTADKKKPVVSKEQASGLVSSLLGVFTTLTSKEKTPVATTYTPSSMQLQTSAPAPAPANYTPWIVGGIVIAVVAAVGLGAFALTRPAAPSRYPPPSGA